MIVISIDITFFSTYSLVILIHFLGFLIYKYELNDLLILVILSMTMQ